MLGSLRPSQHPLGSFLLMCCPADTWLYSKTVAVGRGARVFNILAESSNLEGKFQKPGAARGLYTASRTLRSRIGFSFHDFHFFQKKMQIPKLPALPGTWEGRLCRPERALALRAPSCPGWPQNILTGGPETEALAGQSRACLCSDN